MSRSRVAYLGFFGLLGATLLVTPVMNWTGGDTSPDLTNGYDPLLSEASCGESDSQLALNGRPYESPIKLALANEEEVAFLEAIQPAGGEGSEPGTGGDGPAGGNGLLNNILKDLDDQSGGDGGYGGGGGGGAGGGGGGGGGGGNGPSIASLTPSDPNDPNNPGDPSGPSGPGGPGQGGGCEGPNCEEQTVGCTGPDCDKSDPPVNGRQPLTEVPEPESFGLLALGLGLLAVRRRRSA